VGSFISYRPIAPEPKPRMPWKLLIGAVVAALIIFVIIPTIWNRKLSTFEIITAGGKVAADQTGPQDLSTLYPFTRQSQDPKQFQLIDDPESAKLLLKTSAQSVVVAELATGKVLYQKAAHDKLPEASLTKLFTAVTAYENVALDASFRVSSFAANQEPHRMGVKEGETYALRELLYGLFLASGNDATEVIAEGSPGGRGRFIEAMNRKAEWLELKDTRVQNPSGLDQDQHYSSAWDIATIMRYAYLAHPELKEIMGTRDYRFEPKEGHREYWLTHISEFMKENGTIKAVKTGYTDTAGYCWAAVAEKDGKGIVIAFLNSWAGKEDATRLVQQFLP